MKLSLSVRIAEGFLSKREAIISLPELAELAVAAGFDALCMRASQVGVHSPAEQVAEATRIMQEKNLKVTMVTGDFDIVYNNDQGPRCLRNITPYVDLAESLGAPLIRVCVKKEEDFAAAHAAADEAAQRGIRIAHQCHAASLFETVDQIIESLNRIDHPNFGLIFEAGNLEECRQPYGPATIEKLAPWIFNVYLQNQRLNPDGAITLDTWCHGPVSFDVIPFPEPGGIDFRSVFQGLREIGYDGTVTVHQSAPQESGITPLAAATATAAFLRSI
jgi:sugar phosphate isomerase/epimerase